jgi:hypothetical protein
MKKCMLWPRNKIECIPKEKIFQYIPRLLRWAMWPMGLLLSMWKVLICMRLWEHSLIIIYTGRWQYCPISLAKLSFVSLSYTSAMGYLQDFWRNFKNHISEIHPILCVRNKFAPEKINIMTGISISWIKASALFLWE